MPVALMSCTSSDATSQPHPETQKRCTIILYSVCGVFSPGGERDRLYLWGDDCSACDNVHSGPVLLCLQETRYSVRQRFFLHGCNSTYIQASLPTCLLLRTLSGPVYFSVPFLFCFWQGTARPRRYWDRWRYWIERLTRGRSSKFLVRRLCTTTATCAEIVNVPGGDESAKKGFHGIPYPQSRVVHRIRSHAFPVVSTSIYLFVCQPSRCPSHVGSVHPPGHRRRTNVLRLL